jgi:O-succinylbenzoic acid--CoA ligase
MIPAAQRFPDAPALVDEDGQVWRWGDLERAFERGLPYEVDANPPTDLAAPHPDRPALLLHEPTSGRLVRTLWHLRGSGTVPVLVHPREPAARRDLLAAPVVAGLSKLTLSQRQELADVVFTSGSTGTPRAIAHTAAGWQASAEAAQRILPFGPGDRWLLSLQLAHVSGLGILERARVGGGCVVLPRPGESLARSVRAHAITHLSVVRAQLADLLHDLLADDDGRAAIARLKAVIVGGGPTPARLLDDALRAGVPLHQTWGMTETSAMVTLSAPGRPHRCGAPLPDRDVRLAADGILGVRGPGLAAGFVDAAGLHPLPLDPDGYFITRDRGEWTDTGELVLLGRADTVFISGGENIAPEDVEAALLQHPAVRDALVVPVPHPRWGMRPAAFVAFHPGDPPDLRPWLATRVPAFAIPDAFLPWPPEIAGKPSRTALAARAATLLGVPP